MSSESLNDKIEALKKALLDSPLEYPIFAIIDGKQYRFDSENSEPVEL